METSSPSPLMPRTKFQKNKLAFIGFLTALAGPALMILTVIILSITNKYLLFIPSRILLVLVLLLPAAGAVICIVYLAGKKQRKEKLGRSLSIFTLVMCNPAFYFVYFIACSVYGNLVAGLSIM